MSMTPQRLRKLQELILKHGGFMDGPVAVVPERDRRARYEPWQGSNVVELCAYRAVRFELKEGLLTMTNSFGLLFGESYRMRWIEAEGHIIQAWALDPDGDRFAKSLIGTEAPE